MTTHAWHRPVRVPFFLILRRDHSSVSPTVLAFSRCTSVTDKPGVQAMLIFHLLIMHPIMKSEFLWQRFQVFVFDRRVLPASETFMMRCIMVLKDSRNVLTRGNTLYVRARTGRVQ